MPILIHHTYCLMIDTETTFEALDTISFSTRLLAPEYLNVDCRNNSLEQKLYRQHSATQSMLLKKLTTVYLYSGNHYETHERTSCKKCEPTDITVGGV
jgi:hypothetical protein